MSDTLWVANNERLRYFDGIEWQDLSGLNVDVWGIEADGRSGILWGSAGENLYRWDGEEMSAAGHLPGSGITIGEIAVTGDGTVWAGGFYSYLPWTGGLARYDDTTASWETVRPWRSNEDVPAQNLATTPNGSLWAVLGDFPEDSEELIDEEGNPNYRLVLAYWDSASRGWSIYEENLPDGYWLAIAADDEAVWLARGPAGAFEGLFRFDGETWSHYPPDTDVSDIAIAPDESIWYIAAD